MSRNKGISASSAICDYDRQERIIEEKRNIFLAKKAGLIPPIQLKPKSTTTSPSNQSNVHPQAPHQPDRSNLPFANDGSFFEQFMKIQTPLPDTSSSLSHSRLHPVSLRSIRSPPPLTPTISPSQILEQKPPLPSTPSPAPPCSKKHPPLPPPIPSIAIKAESPHLPPSHPMSPHNLKPSESAPPLPSTSFKPPPLPPVTLKLQPLRQTDQLVTAPIPIFRSEEAHEEPHDPDEGDMVSEFEIAEKMARQLALDGEQAIKEFKRVNKKDGPYSFLCDSSNPVALYFSQKLSEYQHANDPITSPPPPVPPPVPPTPPEQTPRRKTRWSDEGEAVKIPPSVVSAINAAGSQHKQAEVQRALNRLANSIRGARGQGARGQGRGRGMKRFCGIKYEYDSDEENEYGTWEHKRRAVEMQKTSDTANQLTEQAHGKHHLSDYLPGEEYLRFMAQVEKARGGDVAKTEYSDYKDHEIKQDNIGYQMLQRAGWHEGQGLGAQLQGITTPVNKGRSSLDSTGVGSGKVADVKCEDDEFSLYRKRMMLAYKFRPNPLNNPRRPYYD